MDIRTIKQASITRAFGLLVALACISLPDLAMGQALVNNNGALVSILPGAQVIVKTGSVDNITGYVTNGGTLIVEGYYRNGDTSSGGNTTGYYQVEEDWINDGEFIADSSTVELYGANQLITGSSITTFFNLTLTGTDVKTQTLDAITSNVLDLGDRELATETFKHFVTNTDVNAVVRNNGFVSSLGTGRLSRDMAAVADYLFPVGSSVGVTRYRPINITPTTVNAQTIEVRLANNDATTDGFDIATREPLICDVNDLYYHLIGRVNGSDAVDLRASYLPADGPWSIIAHWQNQPRWESTGIATVGTALPFTTVSVSGWNDFNPEPFVLAIPEPTVDTANALITDVTCFGGADGAIDITVLTGAGPIDFNWSVPATTEDVSGLEAGTYTLVMTDTNGCNRNGEAYTFVIDEPLEIDLTADVTSTLCNADSTGAIDLTIANAVTPLQTIQWSNSDVTEDINNLAAGTYNVSVTDANGCAKTLDVVVDEPSLISISENVQDLNCFNDGSGVISLDVSGGTPGTNNAYTYIWSTDDSTQNLSGLDAGTYEVTVIDANNCTATLSDISVEAPDSLGLLASADESVLVGYSTELEVLSTTGGTGFIDYVWTPAESLTDPTSDVTTATPSTTTEYIVTGTDENGCTATDIVLITVNDVPFIAPEGFTPNGDGTNDVFQLYTSPSVEVGELKIFNRWGQVVSDDPTGWNGRFRSQDQPMDTYIFQTVIIYPDGEKKAFQGELILIR